MKKIVTIISGAFISLCFATATYAIDDVTKTESKVGSKMDYKAAKERASIDYKTARAKCDALHGNPKDVCVAEAKADEKRSKANAEARYKNTPDAKRKARIEIAEADYSVAKEKCSAETGDAKAACIRQAKDTYTNTKAETKSASPHEGAGEYVEDTVITTKVKAKLLAELGLNSPEINVETFKGTVQLSGFVSSKENMEKALAVAGSVVGVKGVKNDMRLK